MKSIRFGILLAILALLVVACSSSDQVRWNEQNYTATQMQRLINNQPAPTFDFSMQRDTLIQIYKATNEAVATYTVVTEQGRILWACDSIGYPIPVTTQLTNPDQYVSGGGVVAMAEPNGLYTGNTSGTWIRCVRKNGDVVPLYSEQNVLAFASKVTLAQEPLIKDIEDSTSAMKLKVNTAKAP